MSDLWTESEGSTSAAGLRRETDGESQTEMEISLRQRFFNMQTLISFVAAFAILYFFLARVDIDLSATWARMQQASPAPYLAALGVYYSTFLLRAVRWRLLLANVGFDRASGVHLPSTGGLMEIVLLSWFANCVVPAKLGDAYRAYLLKKNARTSFSTTVGTVVAERVIDMSVLFVLLALSAASVLGRRQEAAVSIVEVGLGFAVLMLMVVLAMRAFGSRIQGWLPLRLQGFYGRFQDGTLHSFQQLPLVVLLTVLIWLGEGLRLLFVTHSLGLSLGFVLVIFVALANSLLTAVPFTPGGLGLVEAGVVGVLLGAGVLAKEDAVSVAMLDRTISYWSLVVVGLLLYLVSRRK